MRAAPRTDPIERDYRTGLLPRVRAAKRIHHVLRIGGDILLPPGARVMALREGGYGQYCPIARAVEVLGERWSLLIVRDLLCGHTRFNDLARGNPRLSRSLLAKRLRQLERAGVVERLDGEYVLTRAGEDLRPVVFGLGEWGAKWQFGDPHDDELDPELLVWWVHDRLDFSVLPDRRIVLEFAFRGERRRFWVVKDASGPSVCTHPPGFEVDVHVNADLDAIYQVWLGRLDLRAAARAGSVELHGAAALVRRMPEVFLLSPVAPFVAAAAIDDRSHRLASTGSLGRTPSG